MDIDIIYEDEAMLVCRKPAGVLAQSNRSFDVDMVSALKAYRAEKKESTYIGVINRLDRPVEGVMVFAKTQEEAARLNRLLQAKAMNKIYMALVRGSFAEEERTGTYEDYMVKEGRKNSSRLAGSDEPQSKYAKLEYEVCESSESVSLVRIRLITGRHHQIRLQFSSRGHAIVGDRRYHDTGNTRNLRLGKRILTIPAGTIALCACELELEGNRFAITPGFA